MIADLERALDALYHATLCLQRGEARSDARAAIAEAIVAILEARGKLRLEPNDAA